MIRFRSEKQLTIEEFRTQFEMKLQKDNRWVILAGKLPWNEMAKIYYRSLSPVMGAPAKDARLVIGALIIKHMLCLDDRETIETIRENMYIQYFLGLCEYTYKDVFDHSLFTTLRYRMGEDKFDAMTCELIKLVDESKYGQKPTKQKENNPGNESGATPEEAKNLPKNQGKLLLDATVADQMIVYPTDFGLIANSRKESERIIDVISEALNIKKPRTYRRNAHKAYLEIAKKRRKTKKEIRRAIGKQLRYLRRNIKTIHHLLDEAEGHPFPLYKRDQRIFFVIQHILEQQMTMHRNRTHSVDDRIVNIYQPYVRPIVRGKDKAQVEFGAKIGVSQVDGYARINTLSWDAYNESTDLTKQVEAYKTLKGYYPEVLIADKIYGNRANRTYLKEHGIRFCGKPLGRPIKETLSPYQKLKQKIERGIRNQIEGKFGLGKNAYELNKVRTRTAKTSESWIACIVFIMNLIKFDQDILFNLFDGWKNRIPGYIFR
ncbi:MAG: IS5 family transposase, partial [Bacteroidetes bacterium]